MTLLGRFLLIKLVLFTSCDAQSARLDDLFVDFQKCQFKDFYFSPWDSKQPGHIYFYERNLKPYKENNGIYHFKVNDVLFNLPVSELVVPGTWGFHGVIFDVPLAKARSALKKRFGSYFAPSKKSLSGEVPALAAAIDSPDKSVLYCNERDDGI